MNIPKKMKAAVLFDKNDLRITEREVPSPGKGEVLLKIKACAICGSDPKIIKNGWIGAPPMGEFIPGHEFTGEVVKLGNGTSRLKIGDRVAIEPHKGCGHCINCIRGLYTTCLNYGNHELGHRHYGFTANGGYAEYAACDENCLHKIPDNISFESATLITTGGTALYGIQRAGWIWPGETVVVIGPGPIGLMAAQIAKICGAGFVIVTGTRESRLNVALKIGADLVLNIKTCDIEKEINSITNGIMADMVIETSGTKEGASQAINLVKKNGRVVFQGIYSEYAPVDINKIVQGNLRLAGGKAEGEYVLERLIPLFKDGRIKTKDIITHYFVLEEINSALDTFINRKDGAIKVVIKI